MQSEPVPTALEPGTSALSDPGRNGFLLSSAPTDREENGHRVTGLLFQGRLADGRRFRWEVTRPRLCFFVDRLTPGPDRTVPPGPAVPHARKPLDLRTLRGHPVDALYFASAQDLAKARRHYQGLGLPLYEADVAAAARHLMERGIQGAVRFLDPPVSESGGVARFVDPKTAPSSFTPALRLLSLDVECAPTEGLFSIALYGEAAGAAIGTGGAPFARVLLRDPTRPAGTFADGYESYPDERSLLRACFAAVRDFDPDALVGWNVIDFDLRYLAGRCERAGLTLDLGVGGPVELIEPEGGGRAGPRWLARAPGRAVLDGIALLKAAFVAVEEGYSLAAVARQVLGERKLIELEGGEKMAEIIRRFREDSPALARYNLEDARLAHAIFGRLGLPALAVRKAQLTGLAVDRMGGSIAALDFLYLPRLHRQGFVADSASPEAGGEPAPGGLVLEGMPGFFRNVLVLDFKSLYPSIIRTFLVDPLAAAAAEHGLAGGVPAGGGTLVRGPAGPAFVRELAILPGIVSELAEARERAKRDRDASLSQAVKILMNSFYGVLGNPACRFHRPELAGAITLTGQWILRESKAYLERAGHRVIYGDTDSLFVHAGALPGPVQAAPEASVSTATTVAPVTPAAAETEIDALRRLGSDLCALLNRHLQETLREKFAVESRLTMEFDKIFLRFFLPALRREERGSKKRYAGLLAAGVGKDGKPPAAALHFTGMESARSDWTALAKDFQAELLGVVFAAGVETPAAGEGRSAGADPSGGSGTALAGVERLVRDWHRRLFAGELDDRLEYRKGLSKDPEEYGASAPPHVRAARALDRREGRIIRYVMTVDGPEPVQKRSGARLDYRHYADKQLAPVADMVLRFLGTDYAALTDEARQLSIL